jgi:hypothetical protein
MSFAAGVVLRATLQKDAEDTRLGLGAAIR